MALKSYFKGKSGVIFWLNVLLAVGVLVAVPTLGLLALSFYTHHGEKIEVPGVTGVGGADAVTRIERQGLVAVVADSNYNEHYRPGVVLVQTPKAGSLVKSGRIIYLTINRNGAAPARIPDIIRNTTVRIAREQLTQLGFRLTPTQYVEDEPQDLVIGLRQGTSNVYGGDMVSRDRPLTIVAGAGMVEDSVEVDCVEVVSVGGYDVLL